jgi:NADH-quinone oxidoreductase subunit C
MIDAATARDRITEFPDAAVSGEGAAIAVQLPPAQWAPFGVFARDELGCTFFSFLTAVDWKDEGLEIVAWVDNLEAGFSLLLKTRLGPAVTACASLTPIYRGAGWMEREAFDMFGVTFDGHSDLRRILLDDDWVGHPLLKSYAVDTPYPPYR